jgi:hypothetical protein
MGDIAVVAAKVGLVYPEKATVHSGIAGATITAGQVLYRIISTGKLGLADEDADAEHSAVVGVALNGGGAGQVIDYVEEGHLYGFTVSGLAYALACSLSATAGALLDTGATTNIVARVEPMPDADLTKVLYVKCGLGLPTAFS